MRTCLLLMLMVLCQLAMAGNPNANWTAFGWNARGCSGSFSSAVELDDGSVLVGGGFTACGDVDANSLVKYFPDTNQFAVFPQGSGFRGPAKELIRIGEVLYVGGSGMTIPGASEPALFANLNLTTGQWHVPTNTPPSVGDIRVEAMAAVSGQIYVAFDFGEPTLLRFDPSIDDWINLGVNFEDIYALHADGDRLLVGGNFESIAGVPANDIAVYSPNQGNTWSALGNAIDEGVLTLTSDADYIYAGGFFSMVGGVATDHVARFSRATQSWERMGQGVVSPGPVRQLRVVDGELYAGGDFSSIDGIQANHVARFDASLNRWQALGSGVGELGTFILASAVVGSDLYLGGSFREVNGQSQPGIARLHAPTRSWLPVGEGITGAANDVIEEIVTSGDLALIRGNFTQIGGTAASQFAQMDCTTHEISPLGGAVSPQFSFNYTAMAADSQYLYLGGGFFDIGGVPAARVARFNLATRVWEGLPGGGPNNFVYDLHIDGNYLYAAGAFTSAGGISARHIARYNLLSNTWETLGSGVQNGTDNRVYVITSSDSGIFAAGDFNEAGGVPASKLALFDPLSGNWSAPGGDARGRTFAMTVVDRALYVGGLNSPGPTFRYHLAKLDLLTGEWSAPGGTSNVNRDINTLIYRNQALLVGGTFSQMSDIPLASIASLDPGSGEWTAMGEGVSYGLGIYPATIKAMAACGDKIVVGGNFNLAGGEISPHIALLDLPGPLFRDSFDQ